MSAPLAVPHLPRAQMPPEYDQATLEQAFQAIEEELVTRFSRSSDLALEPGKKLVLSSLTTNKQYAITLSAADLVVLIDYETGTTAEFVLDMGSVDGLTVALAAIETAYESADAANAAAIAINASAISTNEGAISAIETEIVAARDGEADLIAKITSVETTAVDAETASAANATEITAARDGEASLLAQVNSLQSADAAEAAARASAVTETKARFNESRVVTDPYFSEFSSASGTPDEWTDVNGGSGTRVQTAQTEKVYSFRLPGGAGASAIFDQSCAATEGEHILRVANTRSSAGSTDGMGVRIEWRDSGGVILGASNYALGSYADTEGNTSTSRTGLRIWEIPMTAPANTASVDVRPASHWSIFGSIAVANQFDWHCVDVIPLNTPEASAIILQQAFIDRTTGEAHAAIEAEAAAGSFSAMLRLYAGDGSSSIGLFAEQLYLGDDTVFEDTYNTFYTTNGGYRTRWGGPFGASGDLTLWKGPTSVALNSETVSNGSIGLNDDEIYLGGSVVGLYGATSSLSQTSVITGSSPQVTPSVTVTPQGGDGTYTYAWTLVSGSTNFTVTSPTSASTTFSTSADNTLGEEAIYRCTATETSTGLTATVDVGVLAIYIPPP